ncbi:hypothetical protein ASA1KI_19810 [Opitutales bacterium ASA1]|uniref:hypothetical protein n=1 Tax=Congregicoccus parvus TaxID=3081749 RepID=UPI002B3065F1|nr:hypothetical protein ASA1KI_19810 [Opitutales bacterium ASA1]
MGITAGLAAIMLGIVVNLLDTAGRSSGSLVSSNQAQVALDFLAQDLESVMLFANTDTVGLAATIQPDQSGIGDTGATAMANWNAPSGGTVKPGALPAGDPNSSLQLVPASEDMRDYRFGQAGVWLRMFTVEPDDPTGASRVNERYSVMRTVGYQIVRYRVQDGGSTRYGLFRTFTRPMDQDDVFGTFESSFNLLIEEASGGGYQATPYNLPGPIGGTSQGDPGNIRRPQRSQLIANNVIDFGVRFWKRNGGTLKLMFPADDAGNPSNAKGGFAACYEVAAPVPLEPSIWSPVGSAAANMNYGYPDMAEILLRVLTDEGARQIEALENGRITGRTWWELAEANSEVFIRRVELKGKVL